MARHRETGVVLLNVLVVLAFCAGLLVAMLRLSDIGIARTALYSDAGQALSVVLAGEASAVSALRRDLAEAPLSDHPGEAWARVAQDDVAISGGRFALRITDAQGRLNLTGMTGVLAARRLQALAGALDLRPEVAGRISVALARPAPPDDLAALAREAGLTAAETAVLRPLVTFLPDPTPVNLNTCPDLLMAVLFGNRATAAALAERRARRGFLSEDDIAAVSAVLPPGTGFASRFFAVDVAVGMGRAEQRMQSLLQRGFGSDGVPVVTVVMRRPGSPDTP